MRYDRSFKRHIVPAMIAMLFALALAAASSLQADAADEYGYTMSVSAGNNGSFVLTDGSTVTELKYKVKAGQAFPTIGINNVKVEDDKYSVLGFKEAGREDTVYSSIPAVKEGGTASSDLSYVAVYGVKSNMVKYTVRYLDQDGNALMDDAEYYGSNGSHVQVSFKYIEGYAPTAYNLSKTLSGEGDVLAFRYYASDLTAEEQAAAANNGAAADGVAAANPAAAQAAAIDAATPGTPEVVNLDDQDVPLAGPDDASAGTEGGGIFSNLGLTISLGALAVLLAILAIVIAAKRRKQSEGEVEE